MHYCGRNQHMITLIAAAGIILAVAAAWLATAPPASAQCGSQASSCKNCHEVQGELPVNNDGTRWHTSHAFGDFCYICHAGNNQAKEKTEAHAGMAAPLADIEAACMQCHPSDLPARAQEYAAVLGVEIGSGEVSPAAAEAGSPVAVASVPAGGASVQCTEANEVRSLAVDDPNLVNYTQRYDEIVLGRSPTNWGNVILLGLIGLVAVGGGGFVISREKLIKVSFGDTRQPDGEYPSDVVAMLPALARLKPASRGSLHKVLANPKKAEQVLGLIAAVTTDENNEV